MFLELSFALPTDSISPLNSEMPPTYSLKKTKFDLGRRVVCESVSRLTTLPKSLLLGPRIFDVLTLWAMTVVVCLQDAIFLAGSAAHDSH